MFVVTADEMWQWKIHHGFGNGHFPLPHAATMAGLSSPSPPSSPSLVGGGG